MNLRRRLYATNIRSTKRRVASATQLARLVSVLALLSVAARPASAQVNVLTQHNDIARTGANTNETILTPANVNQTTFGKLFSNTVDGYVYAQPLYYANLTMGAGTAQAGTVHNVFFIATENDSVYAFDADSNGGANASPLWQASLIDSAHGAGSGETPMPNGDVMTTDIVPQIGITGTPVIDPTTNTMYVVAKSTIAGTTFFQRLHALDITTGKEKFGGPVALAAQVKGNGNGSVGDLLKFDPMWENNRPGLLLLNGIVYIGFASHGDNGPWHGWLLAYNAATLQQTSVFCTTPNGQGSGIWQGGAGLAADVPDPVNHPFGRMFVSTGNGTYDATTPYTNGMDFGDDDLGFDLTNGVFTIQDSFTPSNQANLSSTDQDLGSGGPVLLPDQTGAHPHELVQVGKSGKIYVVDRDSMGGYSTTSENIVQEISGQLQGGIWGMPAYWNGNIYFWGRNDNLRAFSVTAGKLSAQGTSVGPEENTFSTPTPAVSSNGATNGIVWALEADTFSSSDPAILRAYDATNVATEFYNSSQNSSRDAAPPAVKFTVPTIANGKVYVGGVKKVSVYGLLSGVNTVATPAISPASQSFTGTVTVTISDSTTGATIHYTTDGSTPTPSSTTYTGPITVNTTETITAIATATGFLTSQPASATFTLTTQTLMPTFNPSAGAYATPQSVALTDASPASKIYYTTNGSTPATSVTGATALYSTPIAVGLGTTTINAIAVATGLSPSPMASSTYAINVPPDIDFSLGFSASTSLMTFNGSTGLDDTRLQLTSGLANQAGSAFFNTPLNIQNFTTDFTIQLSNPAGDGMTFTIQGVGPKALGPSGGGLGYGPALPGATDPASILKSIAIKFDLFSNDGEGANSTGLYTNGESPSTVADSIDLTPSGINLHSGTTMAVHLAYDGANLTMTMTGGANATFTHTWPVNLPTTVGGTTAYVGFTGATGGSTSSQKVETWTFTSNISPTGGVATPMISPAPGTYNTPVMVTLTDSTPNSSIYYTTDGSAPTTTSNAYTSAFQIAKTSTVNAFATANGLAASTVATAAYTITTADFSLKSSSASLTVAQGGQATTTITVAPPTGGSFGSAVNLSCTVAGSVPLPTCSLSPASVTPGSQPATSTLTVSAPASAMLVPASAPGSVFAAWEAAAARFRYARSPNVRSPGAGLRNVRSVVALLLSVLLLALFGMMIVPMRRFAPRRYAWLAVLILALWQTSCGGGGSSSTPTAPETVSQTYTVTVTGVSQMNGSVTIQHDATVTVTVP